MGAYFTWDQTSVGFSGHMGLSYHYLIGRSHAVSFEWYDDEIYSPTGNTRLHMITSGIKLFYTHFFDDPDVKMQELRNEADTLIRSY